MSDVGLLLILVADVGLLLILVADVALLIVFDQPQNKQLVDRVVRQQQTCKLMLES